jgi:hypothetical protein
MEFERVRRSVSGQRAGGADVAAVRRAGQHGPETKGELVSRRLRQLGLSRTIVEQLAVREIGRSGRAESTPSSEQAKALAASAAVRASASAGSPRASLLGARSLSLPSIGVAGSFAAPPALSGRSSVLGEAQTPLSSVVGAAPDAVVERARRRFAERKQLKSKLLADLQALRESEAEQERAKAEALRLQVERERAERARELAQWKEAELAKEERKKLKEERRRDKERRALEEGLRARQSKYLAQLKEVEAAARIKQERAAAEAALAAQCEAARPPRREEEDEPRSTGGGDASGERERKGQRQGRPPRKRGKARMGELRSQYDPAGKLLLPRARGALKGGAPAAKNMTDDEIIEMARRIVSESDQARDPAQLNQREQDEEEQHRLLEQALRSPAHQLPPVGPLAAYELGSAFDLPESSLPDPLASLSSSSKAYLSPGYADGRAAAFNHATYSSSSLKTPPAKLFSPLRGGGSEPPARFSPAPLSPVRLSPVRHALQEPSPRHESNYSLLEPLNESVAHNDDTDIAAWYREQMRSVDL